MLHPLLVQVRDSCIDSWLLWAESAGKVKQRNGKYVATGKLKAEDSVWLPEDQEQVGWRACLPAAAAWSCCCVLPCWLLHTTVAQTQGTA